MKYTYTPKILDNMTIEQIDEELDRWTWEEYAYSRLPDRSRILDLEATKKELERRSEK